MESITTRRGFVGVSALSAARVWGANERIRAGAIGFGGRGAYLNAEFKEIGVEMAAVCDVYEPRLEAGRRAASPGARAYDDYRRLLDDKSLDAVVITTPDHWHAQMAIDAVEAGKDVYLEKPMAHSLEEGCRLTDAVHKTGRVLQVGAQRRSSEVCFRAREIIDSGALGETPLVNCWWHGKTSVNLSPPPLKGKLDWNQWLGPAPKRPFDPRRFYSWVWFWDYAGGYLVGQTVHILDAVHMLMEPGYPLAVATTGKKSLEGAEIPDATSISIEYSKFLAVFTVAYNTMRYLPPELSHEVKQMHGHRARLDVGRESYYLFEQDDKALELKPKAGERIPGAIEKALRAHIRDFLDCVRSRRQPRGHVDTGLQSTIVLSMAVESLRTRRTVGYDPAARKIVRLDS
jgi:predicted dehydrogenase